MGVMYGINLIFNGVLLFPLCYTVSKINQRHEFLVKLITAKGNEIESHDAANSILIGTSICFVVFSLLEMAFYYIYNRWVSLKCIYVPQNNFPLSVVSSLDQTHPWSALYE